MSTLITFFPVDCGDMALIRLDDAGTTAILIDVNIRSAADDPQDSTRDVACDLRERLPRDAQGRPYVDAFLLSHPDKDHCTGLEKHFHLGPIADYPDDRKPDDKKKIVIREIWSSPLVFRRASKNYVLCSDAKAFNAEAKRRVKRFRDGIGGVDGERILVLGEDDDGKTDGLGPILVRTGDRFDRINGQANSLFRAHLLAPLTCSDAEEEEVLSKNNSSTILNIQLASSSIRTDSCRLLTGGDAEVAIWERVWQRHKHVPDELAYDMLLAPHHCSWHSLSYDSWSELGEKAKVAPDARSALGQARFGALVVASSKPIRDDDSDPPCIRAKREYQGIVSATSGMLLCTGEHPNTWAPEPLEFEVTAAGPKKKAGRTSAIASVAAAAAPRAG